MSYPADLKNCNKGPKAGGLAIKDLRDFANSIGINTKGLKKAEICDQIVLRLGQEVQVLPPPEVKKIIAAELPKKIKIKPPGCVAQSFQKYTKRKSPPFPANQCCGEVMTGNDGESYISRADKNGVCRWYRYKGETLVPQKKTNKRSRESV